MKSDKAEIIRLTYKYRLYIMRGKSNITYQEATKLIGPDAAFHLYASLKTPLNKQ